ncbi:probable G-protein coupled receptor Mth-like 3 [Homarus americanus]|uniref:G-protein coupled receptor Mth2-like 3 n=1 Tax=Homarus americanus TaxID=6706 RepID=A0A8J5JVL9_HOMAM|nr:probable G-protein coupled receptor Mth-like 3 [Homarus americanus]XP_042232666.1 probable G-protein coupled receptor Mth-like 3 [Homarus americanus]KAG7163136.1 G-protein coupled receptor Mth2-like 3 [Homarus americanus]
MNLRYCTWKRLEVVTTVILVTIWGVSSNFTQSLTDSQVTESPLTNFTLKKCQCDINHVLDESTCIERKTVVILWTTTNNELLYFNTSMFENKEVAEPQCPGGLPRVVIDDRTFNFVLLPSGELAWTLDDGHTQFFLDYCIEHHVHVGGQVGWEAHVCLPPPPVPRCCPPGYALAHDDSCVAYSGNFAPPIDFNNMPVQWSAAEGDVQNVTCHGMSVVRHLNLNTREGILAYNSERAILEWKSSTKPTTYNREYEYCVGMNNVEQYVAKFCYLDPSLEHQVKCNNSNCVRKCCPQGQLLLGMTCVNSYSEEEIWQPTIPASQNNTLVLAPAENWTVVAGFPFCESFFDFESDVKSYDEFYLLPNGSLHISLYKDSYPPTNYCLDLYLEPGLNYTLLHKAILCIIDPPCGWKTLLNTVLLGISCLFLVATLGVYLGVAEIRDRTYGRCLISMVTAMLASFLTIIINNQDQASSDAECITLAFIGHVSTLATFFWLNVMCYDMWSTLRSSRQKHHSKKVFLLYSIYAWGGPLVVGVVALVIDNLQLKNVILPQFLNGKTCWFYGNDEYWLYLAGIIFVLVVINLFFFIHVAITLGRDFKKRRETFGTNTSQSSNSTKTNAQVWLYIKLFIIMGIIWIAETISGAHQRKTCTYWVFFDIINALQGVFIFFVSVCNKDNKKKIRDAWNPRLKNVQNTLTSMQGPMSRIGVNAGRRGTDVSIGTSDASRKTSVTSLPRKFSLASNIFHPTYNTHRKISTASNLETIPMETTADQ